MANIKKRKLLAIHARSVKILQVLQHGFSLYHFSFKWFFTKVYQIDLIKKFQLQCKKKSYKIIENSFFSLPS